MLGVPRSRADAPRGRPVRARPRSQVAGSAGRGMRRVRVQAVPRPSRSVSTDMKPNDHGGSRAERWRLQEPAFFARANAPASGRRRRRRATRRTRRSGEAAGPSATAGCSHCDPRAQRGSGAKDRHRRPRAAMSNRKEARNAQAQEIILCISFDCGELAAQRGD